MLSAMGVGMNGHITRRRRLLILLAGFFSLATASALSAVPGTVVTAVISTNTAAAAGAPGIRHAAPSHLPTRFTAVAATVHGPASTHTAHTAPAQTTAHGVAVLRADTHTAPARPATGVLAERQSAPLTVLASAVQVRGPPSITGSHVLSR
jgi:hypothetical protein